MTAVQASAERRWADQVEATSLRSMLARRRVFLTALALTLLIGLVALGAWAYQFIAGLGVAGYSDQAFWGIYEANLVAFIGVSYGGALVSAILRLTGATWRAPITRIAEATALVSLLIGASFAIIHLGRPDRVLQLLFSPNLSSPIVWDFAAITTYLAATAIFVYLPLVPDLARVRDRMPQGSWRRRIYGFVAISWQDTSEQRRRLDRAIGAVAVLIIPLAISVHSVLAWTFSMSSRPGWHSTIFGPYFVVGALFSGVALVIIVVAGLRRLHHLDAFIETRHFVLLARIMAVLGFAYAYFTFSELLTAGYAHTQEELPIVAALLEGSYAPAFWAFIVGGLIVPIALVVLPTGKRIRWLVLAAVLVVLGMWLKRMLITLPSATVPLIGDEWGSFAITAVPALITLAATAGIPLGLLLFFRFVPLLAIDEVVELVPPPDGAEVRP